jgi:hypothetical protein
MVTDWIGTNCGFKLKSVNEEMTLRNGVSLVKSELVLPAFWFEELSCCDSYNILL